MLETLTALFARRDPAPDDGPRPETERALAFAWAAGLGLALILLGAGVPVVAAAVGLCAATAALVGMALASARAAADQAALRRMEFDVNARTVEAVRRSRGLEAVADVGITDLPFERMLEELLHRVTGVLEVDDAAIFVRDEEADRLLPAAGLDGDAVASVGPEARQLAAKVAEERRSHIQEAPAPPEAEAADSQDPAGGSGPDSTGASGDQQTEPPRCLAAVPLMASGRAVGALVAALPASRLLSDEERRFLELAADRVAVAIDRSKVHHQAQRIAETLQRSLLPGRLPDLPGLEIATRYQPGAEGTQVGGDLYDVVPYPDGRVGVAIGDVVGRGVEAASLMGRLRNALQAFALEGDPPERVLERLNRQVGRWEGGGFATLFYLVFDPRAATAVYANAGHLPPLVRSPNGKTSLLEGGASVPLGVTPVGCYREALTTLSPGSTLVLYTDGLVEERGVSLDDGFARLRTEAERSPDDVERMCDHLLATVPPAGAHADDAALLALHITPLGARPLELKLPAVPDSLSTVRRALERWLQEAGASSQEIADLVVACGEACTNVTEHAYGSQAPGEMVVTATRTGGSVEITVRDHGLWRPPEAAKERGRGVELMRRLANDAQVAPGSEGTTVRLRRGLGPSGKVTA